jgi:hypothetical protein
VTPSRDGAMAGGGAGVDSDLGREEGGVGAGDGRSRGGEQQAVKIRARCPSRADGRRCLVPGCFKSPRGRRCARWFIGGAV